ncbi:MAG: metallophosphoesterase, partial [Deltaproteobacteria bacterium]|nr:metallophosphoesterase [Deltaproteobacteria bacterium]
MKINTLKRSLTFATAVVILLAAFSCGPAEPSFSFAFLTDTHLQPEKQAPDGFKLAIGKVNELEPDFVLTGGDQVFDAFDQNFERADLLYNLYLETAKLLNVPVYNTMGNHDIFGLGENAGIDPEHPEAGKNMFVNRQAKNRYYSFDHEGWHFMVLDSV